MCTKPSILHFVTECKQKAAAHLSSLDQGHPWSCWPALSVSLKIHQQPVCAGRWSEGMTNVLQTDRQTGRQTGPAGALWIANLGPGLESASIIALSLLFHPLFPKLYWTQTTLTSRQGQVPSAVQYEESTTWIQTETTALCSYRPADLWEI